MRAFQLEFTLKGETLGTHCPQKLITQGLERCHQVDATRSQSIEVSHE